jgi:hypothetical protein
MANPISRHIHSPKRKRAAIGLNIINRIKQGKSPMAQHGVMGPAEKKDDDMMMHKKGCAAKTSSFLPVFVWMK